MADVLDLEELAALAHAQEALLVLAEIRYGEGAVGDSADLRYSATVLARLQARQLDHPI